MRVLVLTTALRYTPDVQLLLHLAAALGARGDVVGVACVQGSEVDRAATAEWPRLSLRRFGSVGSNRHTSGVKEVVGALRPDVMLVRSEADARLASAAMGARGGVVRLMSLEAHGQADAEASGGRWSFGRSRARIVEWGRRAPALSWPGSGLVDDVRESGVSSELLVLPPLSTVDVGANANVPAPYDEHTATALRGAAHLRARHPSLKVTLLGDAAGMQSARVHAASLGLTGALSIRPLHALLALAERGATALWVADQNDLGAICTMAAMRQGLPVVMTHDAAASVLVAPFITGVLDQMPQSATALAPAVSIVMELARLLGDPTKRRAMGEAARAKADREHGWESFVDDAVMHLAKAAGLPARERSTAAASVTS
jgi:hypothetical protein